MDKDELRKIEGFAYKQLGVRLRADVWQKLDAHWVKTRISKTAIVEMAVKEYLEGLGY